MQYLTTGVKASMSLSFTGSARWRRALAAMLCLTCSLSSAQVGYVYDAAGRLRQVTDQNGDSAQYSYDANGNIVRIARFAAGALSVVEFSPLSGPSGTALTIFGTGFSSTPSSNQVSIGGIAAAVSSSTATQLVVTVPSGAATGKVAVQVGASTAQSLNDFSVGSLPTPSITSFSPTLTEVAGTVTFTGTNFASEHANNRMSFGSSFARTTASTTTTLVATVPVGGTSGHVSLTTPDGTTTSAADLFVVPSGYTTGAVGYTGRLPLNTPTAAGATDGKVGLLIFDGMKGQELGLGMPAIGPSSVGIAVKNPSGTELLSTSTGSTNGWSLPKLPESGTYTIVASTLSGPTSTWTGTFTLAEDISQSITAGGAPVTAGTTYPGQRLILTFPGSTGQRVSFRTANASIVNTNAMSVTMQKPDGTTLASNSFVSVNGFIDTQTLPTNGAYRVVADPFSAGTLSSATFTLYAPVDTTGSITAGGAPVTVSTTVPGETAYLAFGGSSGQRVSVGISNVTITGAISFDWVAVTLQDASGSILGSATNSGNSGFIEPVTIPSNGTYRVSFHPPSGGTATGTVALYDVPPDVTGSITPGGASVGSTISVPGQKANYSFTGTAGQRVSLTVSGIALTGLTPAYMNSATFSLNSPTGTNLASVSGSSTVFIEPVTLATNGTYSVGFDPSSFTTGTATLTLSNVPPDASGSVTVNGSTATVPITAPGQNGTVTFSGTAGQQVTVKFTGNSIGQLNAALRNPSGGQVTGGFTYSGSFNLPTVTLSATGTYTIFLDPTAASTGSVDVQVTSP